MKKIIISMFLAAMMLSCSGNVVEFSKTPDFNKGDSDTKGSDDDSNTGNTSDSGDDGNTGNTSDSGDDGNTGNTANSGDDGNTGNTGEAGDCINGTKKCSDTKKQVLECIDEKWEKMEDCSGPLSMCVEEGENAFCKDLHCVPGTTTCQNDDIYRCNSDGMGFTFIKECNPDEYCNDANDPTQCSPKVCPSAQVYCEDNELRECNEKGSAFAVIKACGEGVCDAGLKECVFTGEMGGNSLGPDRTGKRGNFFNCTKDVEVVEFSQRFSFTGSKEISWTIYEAEGNSTNYTRIFLKTATVTGTGDAQYSTGKISVNLVDGKKYLFAVGWSGKIGLYDNGSKHPIDVGFGTSFLGYNDSADSSMPETLSGTGSFNLVYNQQIKFVE
ncbi:MAG: hypothetical protein ACOX2F_03050 [bacterium]